MTSRAGLAGALLSIAFLGACARSPRAPEALPPPVPLPEAEVQSFLDAIERQARSVQRYQGLIRARGRGPEGAFDARLAAIFERPARLRVELLGAFGGTRWSAVCDQEGIRAYFPGRRQYLSEPEVEEVVARLLGIRLGAEEMMAALSGVGLPLDRLKPVTGSRRGDRIFLELDTASARTIEIDAEGQVVAARAPDYRVLYPTDWKRRKRAIPDELVIESDTVRSTLSSEDVDVNVALDPEAFLLEIPEDAQRLRPAEIDGEAVFVLTKEPR